MDETQTPSSGTPASPDKTAREQHAWLILAVVVVLLASAGYGIIALLSEKNAAQEGTPSRFHAETPAPLSVVNPVRSGDYASALANARAILDNPNSSEDEKAIARFSALGAEYRLTGDTAARLADIATMKRIVSDTSISLYTRINALNTLANLYSISGRDPEVFNEIYKGMPFESFKAEGDPDLSARRLFEWSYAQMPTSFAAINIARWYSEQLIRNPDQAPEVTAEYAAIAEDYLKKADDAAALEAAQDANFRASTRNLVYQYWRTLVIGRLATQIGAPYDAQYRDAYLAFFEFAASLENVFAREYELYARLFFAQRLARTGDEATAKEQLAVLTGRLEAIENPGINPFVRFLRNERANRPDGANWQAVRNLYELSPEFKVAVESVL